MATARKKKSEKQRERNGQVVRLSKEVLECFPKGDKDSYDQAFRNKLGIGCKDGSKAKETYWLLTRPRPRVFSNKASALGASIVSMVKKGNKNKEVPRKVLVLK